MSNDDLILPINRVISALVVPVLFFAFGILYFFPQHSGTHFAWEITPYLTAMFMGAGYVGGSWLFINVIFQRRWHRVGSGFLPVTSFTSSMFLATILHWDRFDPSHFPFILWLFLYVTTPFLIFWMWWINRKTDPVVPDQDEILVPVLSKIGVRVVGILCMAFALVGFLFPQLVIQSWVWELKPLTARILSGWFLLLGVGGLIISMEKRWSAWRAVLESIAIWFALNLIAAFTRPEEFLVGVWNGYVVGLILILGLTGVLYTQMELRRRRQLVLKQSLN